MVEQHQERYEQVPPEMLVDGGFAQKGRHRTGGGTTGVVVFAPVKKIRNSDADPHVPHPDDSLAVAEWRVRDGHGGSEGNLQEARRDDGRMRECPRP